MRLCVLFASFVILVFPMSFSSAQSSDNLAEYWVGKSATELVTSWGEASKTKQRSEGRRVLVFRLRFLDETEVDAPGWYFNERNEPQNVTNTGEAPQGTLVTPASTIPGPVGVREVKTKKTVKFLVDSHDQILKVWAK